MDPKIPLITQDQMRMPHGVAAEAGYSHDDIRRHAAVDSLTTLSWATASNLIDRYRRLIESRRPTMPAALPRRGFGHLPKSVAASAPVKTAVQQPTAPSGAVASSDPVSKTPKASWLKPDGSGKRWTVVDEIPW